MDIVGSGKDFYDVLDETQEWVLRRSFKLGIGFIVLLVTIAIFEKTFRTGCFLYIW